MEVPYVSGQKYGIDVVLIPSLEKSKYPVYKDRIRIVDEDEKERNSILWHGIKSFGFLIPTNVLFRISLLGQLIKEYTTDEKALFIADLMLVNGYYLSPFRKDHTGNINQI